MNIMQMAFTNICMWPHTISSSFLIFFLWSLPPSASEVLNYDVVVCFFMCVYMHMHVCTWVHREKLNNVDNVIQFQTKSSLNTSIQQCQL